MTTPTVNHPTRQANYCEVHVNGITYAFSYRTCIGASGGWTTITRQNEWGPTTGKHLNYWSTAPKDTRLDAKAFAAALAEMEAKVNR